MSTLIPKVYQPATGAVNYDIDSKLNQFVDVLDFGADPTGVADSTTAIQAAINYACSLVTADTLGDPINGCTVLFRGVYKITDTITISKGNIVLDGQGGTTIHPYFTTTTAYNGAQPAFIFGTGIAWQTGSVSNTYKYNRINGFMIKKPTNTAAQCIGVLFSGTRNASATNMEIENQYCGIYLENTSEFVGEQLSAIGCIYGFISDSRVNRTASNSVLKTACTVNDVSSVSYYQCIAYYPQSSGVMLIDSGTHNINGMTIGQFSSAIDTSGKLGFPAVGAGLFINGGSNAIDFTRGMLASNIVFEANPTINSNCIYINQTVSGQPIQGVTFDNCVVQTYADAGSSYTTTFISAQTINPGLISNVVCRDCGFVYQTSGYYYGQMANNNGNVGVRFENCYPIVAFANSNLSPADTIVHRNVVDTPVLTAFPPSGWATQGTVTGCSSQGGSSGVPASLKFTGDTGQITISKNYVFRDYQPLAAPYIEFLYNGNGAANLVCYAVVNSVASTASNGNTSTYPSLIPEYSNALFFPKTVTTTNNRVVFTFNPFAANYPFNDVTFYIGKAASGSSSDYVSIQNITVGWFPGLVVPYNPF